MEYQFRTIEKKWQQRWEEEKVYLVENNYQKPKCYVLDMFPYPSGAGLHVGHPLGYIASDIYARYKRLKGFNVLHPMGFDAFGLPAEQYAIETGQHPAVTTEKNIASFKEQMNNIGFCYDWSREVRTSEPDYYKWTQWIFLQLFHSWYNRDKKKAEPIDELIASFDKEGNVSYPCPADESVQFSSDQWKSFDKKTKQDILMNYRLAYCGYGDVNWCEALGTVLANDEVINGVSERGGYPVIKKKLRQWYLRITEYADRLLEGLRQIEFSEAMKEMQSNWIGKSVGADIVFLLSGSPRRGERSQNLPGFGYAEYKVANGVNFENARKNRKNPTEAESVLWNALRNRATGYKFRRQHPIENYIVDFVCLDAWIVVEVDGGYHNTKEQQALDIERDRLLKELGFITLRVTNEEVLFETEKTINKIKETCNLSIRTSMERKEDNMKPSPHWGKGGVRVFTTRPDTIFGVDFMVLAPEHELVEQITTPEQSEAIDEYLAYVNSRSERERMAEKKITGCFTGAYAIHPFSGKEIPIWVSEYVLAGYGTGAIMAVPCGDERDHRFAKHFNIPITNIIGDSYNREEANPSKDAVLQNSDFLNGMKMQDAIEVVIQKVEEMEIGKRKVNYKMRDAAFSRQRYWGEPFPIIWKDGIAIPLDEKELPLQLPHVETYKPGPEGEGPLANITAWVNQFLSTKGGGLETNTMPGYAGSSWYFLRYMDPRNEKEFADRKATDYWNQVDVYIGGTEHAVGHLLYSRMWTKVLHDLGFIGFDEPYRKLINQGMIAGDSRFVYRIQGTNQFVSHGLKDQYQTDELHVDVNIVDGFVLDTEAFKKWKPDYEDAAFILENGQYICGSAVEKMSKSKYNVVNPDIIVDKYGADTFRMYEMFLGPIEQSKPWDTKGIEGVHRFLKKLWRLFYEQDNFVINNDEPAENELRILHKAIKKIQEDTERFSFNTAVSQFMICVNELAALNCHKRKILEPLLILLTPYAPHISEELWHQLGNKRTVLDAAFPTYNEQYLKENNFSYPVAVNGKTRTELSFPVDTLQADVEKEVLANEIVQKWMDGKPVKKFIVVKGRMINVVV